MVDLAQHCQLAPQVAQRPSSAQVFQDLDGHNRAAPFAAVHHAGFAFTYRVQCAASLTGLCITGIYMKSAACAGATNRITQSVSLMHHIVYKCNS